MAAAACKHWIVHGEICCKCRSKVKTYEENTKVVRATSLFPNCGHRMYKDNLCYQCGHSIYSWDSATTFNYIAKSLRLSPEFEADIKQQKFKIGLGQRKLHLVLNLEHVLIDQISLSKLSEIDKFNMLINYSNIRNDLFHFPSDHVLVKLRPFVREFLQEANEMFIMHVFTNYDPAHANNVVKLLDPHMVYFGNRIITSRDSKGSLKSLKLVLTEPRGLLILDYDHRLWVTQDHPNILVFSKYVYFKESSQEINNGIIAKTLNYFFKNKVADLKEKRNKSPDDENSLLLKGLLSSFKKLHELFFNGSYQDVVPLLPHFFYARMFA